MLYSYLASTPCSCAAITPCYCARQLPADSADRHLRRCVLDARFCLSVRRFLRRNKKGPAVLLSAGPQTLREPYTRLWGRKISTLTPALSHGEREYLEGVLDASEEAVEAKDGAILRGLNEASAADIDAFEFAKIPPGLEQIAGRELESAGHLPIAADFDVGFGDDAIVVVDQLRDGTGRIGDEDGLLGVVFT